MARVSPASSRAIDPLHALVLGDDVADQAADLLLVAEPVERRVQVVVRRRPAARRRRAARAPSSQPARRLPYSPSLWACLTRVSTTSSRRPSAARSKGIWRWERSRVSRYRAWPVVAAGGGRLVHDPGGGADEDVLGALAQAGQLPAARGPSSYRSLRASADDDLQGRRGGQARRPSGPSRSRWMSAPVTAWPGLAQRPDDAGRVGRPAAGPDSGVEVVEAQLDDAARRRPRSAGAARRPCGGTPPRPWCAAARSGITKPSL